MAARTIIIDHGSGFVKAGRSGWNYPQLILPSIVNYIPCQENPGPSHAQRQVSLGIDPFNPDTFSHPIERGRVVNWEGVEHIWSFVLEHHRLGHMDCPVMLTDFPLRDPVTRKKTLEIMFELQDVPSLFLADQLEMSLYASGLLTGVVVDSGYGLTQVQPFLLGRPLLNCKRTLEFGSEDLSTYLFKSLFKEKCDKHDLFQMNSVAEIQMKRCYVPSSLQEALDFNQGLPSGSSEGSVYQLPDGSPVELMPLELMAPEMFFHPQVFGLQGPSISQCLVDSIKSCEVPRQQMLTSHVVPCGGNSLYPGFTERLSQELNSGHFPCEASVWLGERRHFSVWLGASVLAHLSSYRSQWMPRQEYLESMRV
ncbi:actin-like protein 8 [Fukomys damarensis]|uniref:Actin-like protein 8 n=1 Tax=Fukomys damarensis TaxID=885580 RepID=A0A091D8L0_FUKDA|nr:actin-like protein 8 [Fukomys damarensis]XP_010612500.1 actin-like protein 8 [Fukomys damarensis]XP_010612501.1 actin-like protein 8 [Fukomys damarensis]KFO19156.1 Actin-like protein 8 [Fukomys damarensis]